MGSWSGLFAGQVVEENFWEPRNFPRNRMSTVKVAALLAFATVLLVFAAAQEESSPHLYLDGTDSLVIYNGYVRALFNLTRGALEVVQGRFVGDGNFTLSPNLAGNYMNTHEYLNQARGALDVSVSYFPKGKTSTSSFDRQQPLEYIVLTNSTTSVSYSVALTDSEESPHIQATFIFGLEASNPRQLIVDVSISALVEFNAMRVAVSTSWTPTNVVTWFQRGVRQGMNMTKPYIASNNTIVRYYAIGDGSMGAVEIIPLNNETANVAASYVYAGIERHGSNSGLSLVAWGTVNTFDEWTNAFLTRDITVPNGATTPLYSLAINPNDYSFPPSQIPTNLPAGTIVDDLRSILTATHGSEVASLLSYQYYPEVRVSPCLLIADYQCYSPMYNFYDPDGCITNSALLYSFDPMLQSQAQGELDINLLYVCGDDTPAMCEPGQAMHHFVPTCLNVGPQCMCATGPGGVEDCLVYDAISTATQTGPNVFQLLAALRYAGTTGNITWLQQKMPTMQRMMGFLDARFNEEIGLYLAPGSLQIDTFIRVNFTADSNAASIILCELYADALLALGNSTGSQFYLNRANAVRAAMNVYLMADTNDHYCTQSDPTIDGGVHICARDFVDYDANSLAVAARVPLNITSANAVLARMDSGNCTHHGRATYVSEIYYNASNCVINNTGDSAVTMGRIAWQDALARQAVGDEAAISMFNDVILAPLQSDLLRRTWLPERYTCEGLDAHNEYYHEYPSTVAMMIYEVKYGISIQLSKVIVNPLGCYYYDFQLGQLWIGYYNNTGFHAKLTDSHSGMRTFNVYSMQEGVYNVTQSGYAPVLVDVGANGLLAFDAEVGPGHVVDAVLT